MDIITRSNILSKLSTIVQLVGECLTLLDESQQDETQGRVYNSPPITVKVNAVGEGPVLARPGDRSYCSGCKRDVYEVVNEVRGKNVGINMFITSFKALGGAPAMSREIIETILKDKQENVYVDCPLCKGDKTLMLIGTPDRTAREIDAKKPVESIDPGELGLL